MKHLILISLTALLFSCGPATTTDMTNRFLLPPELSDCKVYRLKTENNLNVLYVVNCPETISTITTGKNAQNVTVVKRVKIDTTIVLDTLKE